MNPDRKQSRLDFFLVSEDVFQYEHNSGIVPGYRTDHSGVYIKVKLQDNERGKGYWKFNNSLLKDTNYIQTVKNTIEDTLRLYTLDNNNNNYNNNNNNNNNNTINNNNNNNNNNDNNPQFTINDQLLLEVLLMMIRGETIKYSSRKKKEMEREETNLEKQIRILEDNCNGNLAGTNENDLNLLEEKKTRLEEIRKKKIEGVMLRSRCRYADMGEKPTKYFLNLESRNFTSKVITKIIDTNDVEYVNTHEIINQQREYYKTLYSETIHIDDKPIEETLGENTKRLSENDSSSLEGKITYSEILSALKSMKLVKVQAMMGLQPSFFKCFWSD